MRTIKAKQIVQKVSDLAKEANFIFPEPFTNLIDNAILKEDTPIAKQALSAILANIRLAKSLPLPICQDTGMAEVFVEIGNKVQIDLSPFSNLEDVISEGIAIAYKKYYLRASVVDPLTRKNTGNNAPAIVHTRLVSGDPVFSGDRVTLCNTVALRLMVKGFGSENMGRVINLSPGAEPEEIIRFVVKCVEEAGSRPCPPVFIGCGIGGTMEKASLLAKEALLCPEEVVKPNQDKTLRSLEKEILRRINRLGIGPAGLGGKTTGLAVKVKKFPTHIAGLPVAVNISCWALRVSSGKI